MANEGLNEREVELHRAEWASGGLNAEHLLDFYNEIYLPITAWGELSSLATLDPESGQAFPGDLSDEGQKILMAAQDTDGSMAVDDANVTQVQFELACDAAFTDALAAADSRADIYYLEYQRKLDRYLATIAELSSDDQETVRQINRERFGFEMPTLSSSYRKIQEQLATELPDAYLQRYSAECETLLKNRGKPFKRILKVTEESGQGFVGRSGTYVITQEDIDPSELDEPSILFGTSGSGASDKPQ